MRELRAARLIRLVFVASCDCVTADFLKKLMTDYFENMELMHCAGLSVEQVRSAFQARGALWHPDAAISAEDRRGREKKFQQLNEAYSVLSSTPKRLKHLIQLRGGSDKAAVLNESVMNLFSVVNAALQAADALLAKQSAAASALAKALLAGESLTVEETLSGVAGQLLAKQEVLQENLLKWDAAAHQDIATLQSMAQEAAFLEKWEQQVQRRRLQLMQS